MLFDLAKPHINFRSGCRVASVDPSTPSVILDSGEMVTADVVIGADGIRSVVRDIVVGHAQNVRYTGDSAYRFTIPAEDLLSDQDLAPLVNHLSVWVGPQKHLVVYGIVTHSFIFSCTILLLMNLQRGQKIINVVACVEDGDEAAGYSWLAQSDSDGMRAQFSGWEPR